MTRTEQLVRITAPHFVAGLILKNDLCTKAAPILSWAVGRPRDQLRSYCTRKGWSWQVVPQPSLA